MAIETLVRPLLQVPLFSGLKPLQITEIARRADRTMYRPGEVIIRDRQPGDAAILIVEGEAVRVEGPERGRPAEKILAGSMLAEMAMLVETEHTSTVVARTVVKALRISRADMLRQMAEDSQLAQHFVDQISGRMSALLRELSKIESGLSAADYKAATPAHVPGKTGAQRSAAILH